MKNSKPPRHKWNVLDSLNVMGVLLALIGGAFFMMGGFVVGFVYVTFGALVFYIPWLYPMSVQKSMIDEMLRLYGRWRRLGCSRVEATRRVLEAFGLL